MQNAFSFSVQLLIQHREQRFEAQERLGKVMEYADQSDGGGGVVEVGSRLQNEGGKEHWKQQKVGCTGEMVDWKQQK